MLRLAFVMVMVVVQASCGAGLDEDVCDDIDGRTFYSGQEMECGLGQDGIIFCNWSVRFDAGSFSWNYSDQGASGTYTCAGSDIHAEGFDATYSGGYDVETGTLIWEGATYQ